ncbi:ComEC/Rec2 family competence protein [Candidatus Omnitrophota bacterium]
MQILHNKIALSALFYVLGLLCFPLICVSLEPLLCIHVFLLLCMGFSKAHRFFMIPYLIFIFCSAGLVLSLETPSCFLNNMTRESFLDTWVEVCGVVDSFPTVTEKGKKYVVKFEMRAYEITCEGIEHKISERMLVSWFGKKKDIEKKIPLYGDTLEIWGKLRLPRQATNKGQFDYRRYLRHKRIFVLLHTFGNKSVRWRNRNQKNIFKQYLAYVGKFREKVRRCINNDFTNIETRSLAHALIIGDRKSISNQTRESFVRTGTIHLLAISGLHISILGLFLYFFFRLLRIPYFLNGIIVIVTLCSYAFFSGYNIPVRRAVIMGTLYVSAMIFQKERNFVTTLSIALWIILLVNPHALHLVGLQLSFITVCAIVVINPLLNKGRRGEGNCLTIGGVVYHYFSHIITSSSSALFGAIPLLAYHFNLISLVSILANCLVIPLVTLILFLNVLYLISVFFPIFVHGFWVMSLNFIFAFTAEIITFLSKFSYAVIRTRSPTVLHLLVYYVVIAIITTSIIRFKKITRLLTYTLFVVLLVFVVSVTNMLPQLLGKFENEETLVLNIFNCKNIPTTCVQFPWG